MVHAITRKLHRFEELTSSDVLSLDVALQDARTYSPCRDIVQIRTQPNFALVIMSGWAFRYKVLRDGTRRITDFLLPGDFCHLNLMSHQPMDHSIAAMTTVRAAHIQPSAVERLLIGHSRLASAVRQSQVADEAQLRAIITNIGRQSALQRVGFLLCDLWVRADAIGLIESDRLEFPITQACLADHVGLTAVHVNRMMQRLRTDGLLKLVGRSLTLPEFDRLARVTSYEATAIGRDRPYTAPVDKFRWEPLNGTSFDARA